MFGQRLLFYCSKGGHGLRASVARFESLIRTVPFRLWRNRLTAKRQAALATSSGAARHLPLQGEGSRQLHPNIVQERGQEKGFP